MDDTPTVEAEELAQRVEFLLNDVTRVYSILSLDNYSKEAATFFLLHDKLIGQAKELHLQVRAK